MCGIKLAYLFVFSALSLAANAAPNAESDALRDIQLENINLQALNNEIRNLNWRNSRNIRNIQDLQNLQKIQSLRDVLNLQDEATIINGQVNADLRNIDLLNRYGPQSPLNIIDRRDIVQNGVESFTSTDVVDITDIQQPGSESIQVSESIRPSNILDTNQRLDLEGRPTNVVGGQDIVDIQRPGSETSQVTETVSPTNDLRSELRTGSLNNLLPGYPRRSSLRPRPVRPLRSARLNSNRWGLGPNVGRRGLVSPVNSGSLLNSLLSRPVSQNWNNEPIRLLGSRSLIEDRVPSVYQRSSLGVDKVNSVLGSGRTVPELDRVNTIVGSGQAIRSLINNRLSSGYQRSPLNIDRVNSVVGSGQTVRSLTDDRVPLGSQIPPVDVERIDTIIGQPSDNVVIVTNDIERPGSSGSSTYPTYEPRSTQDLEVITSERIVNGRPVLSSEEVIVDTSVSSSTSASPLSSALPQSTASDYEVIRSNTIVNGDPVSSTEEIIVERPSLNIPTNPWERVQQLGNNLQQTATSAAETDIENLVYTTLQELWELWNLWSQRRGQLGLPPLSLPSSGSSNSGPRRWIDRSEVGNVCVCYDDSKYIPWNVRRQIAA